MSGLLAALKKREILSLDLARPCPVEVRAQPWREAGDTPNKRHLRLKLEYFARRHSPAFGAMCSPQEPNGGCGSLCNLRRKPGEALQASPLPFWRPRAAGRLCETDAYR